jgi:hypothetical protein
MICTHCEGTGFLNIHQVDEATLKMFDETGSHEVIKEWIVNNDSDVQVCDCCGDGHHWHGEPGEHSDRDYGQSGPYAYNGGLPKCW